MSKGTCRGLVPCKCLFRMIRLSGDSQEKSAIPSPKYFSKNALSFSMIPCFFLARFPPPKRETGGISRSMSVPVVLTAPSRNAFAINFRVSSAFSFSVEIISAKSACSCSDTYRRQSPCTELSTFTRLFATAVRRVNRQLHSVTSSRPSVK